MKDHDIYASLTDARTTLQTMIPTATNDKFRHAQLRVSLAMLNALIAAFNAGNTVRYRITGRRTQNSR